MSRTAAICILQFSILHLQCSPISAAEPAPSPPIFVLHTASGRTATGPIQELGPSWSVVLGGTTPATRVDSGDLVSLRRLDTPLPSPPTGAQFLFFNGDRLPGTMRELKGEQLTFSAQLGTGQIVTAPLSAVAVLWLDDPSGGEKSDLLRRRLLAEKRSLDVVRLRNGDVLQGNLAGIDGKFLVLEVDRKDTKIELDKVALAALNSDLARSLKPKTAYAHLVLANGARLSLASATIDRTLLKGTTLFGAKVEVPIDQVIGVDIRQGKAVYLSDLKPKSYKHTPFLGVNWPYVVDGSVAGRDFRLAGSTYDKGLGMHSQSEITYALGGAYRRFETLVGLDDETGKQGSVRLKVLVDGKPRDFGWDKELTARDGPKLVNVDVVGAQELTLLIEFGRGGDVQDHVNWADARLIK